MRKVKLSWEDQLKIKEKKAEDIINLNQTEHQSMEVKVHKKSIPNDLKTVDYYDSYILEKALFNLKIETEKQSPKAIKTIEDEEHEVEFHEQYF